MIRMTYEIQDEDDQQIDEGGRYWDDQCSILDDSRIVKHIESGQNRDPINNYPDNSSKSYQNLKQYFLIIKKLFVYYSSHTCLNNVCEITSIIYSDIIFSRLHIDLI